MLVCLDLLLLHIVCVHSFIYSCKKICIELLLFARHCWGWAKMRKMEMGQTSQRLYFLHWPFFDLHLWSDWSPPLTDFGKLNVPFPEVSDPTFLNFVDHNMNLNSIVAHLAASSLILSAHRIISSTASGPYTIVLFFKLTKVQSNLCLIQNKPFVRDLMVKSFSLFFLHILAFNREGK